MAATSFRTSLLIVDVMTRTILGCIYVHVHICEHMHVSHMYMCVCVRARVYKCPTCCTPHTRLTKSFRKDQDQYHPNKKLWLFSNSSGGMICNSSNGDTRCKATQPSSQTTSEGSQRPDTHRERGKKEENSACTLKDFWNSFYHIISLPQWTCMYSTDGDLLGQRHSAAHCEQERKLKCNNLSTVHSSGHANSIHVACTYTHYAVSEHHEWKLSLS